MLLQNYCQLADSYLSERKFKVLHEGVYSTFKSISAGVLQCLGPLLYLLYIADIPIPKDTVLGTFTDDTVIMTKDATQSKALEKLQVA